MQWKSGPQEFDTSRQASVSDLSSLRHTITGLINGVAYTVRVLAYNHHGDGDPSPEADAECVDNRHCRAGPFSSSG